MIYLRDYAAAEVAFSTARSPTKGKPIRPWCRLFKRGDHYEVAMYSWPRANYVPFCTISPCNILTFVADTSLVLSLKHSLSTSLRRLMPIDVQRQRKGVYKFVWVSEAARNYRYYGGATRGAVKKYGVEYFPGLQFDMATGECTNRKPDAMDIINPAKRKEWLRIIVPYMRGIRARIKVGALDKLQVDEKLKRSPKNPVRYTELLGMVTNWEDEATQAMAYQCVIEGIYPPQLLHAVVRSTPLWGYRSSWDQPALYRAAQTMQRHTSHNFRERFGVFTLEDTGNE